MQRENASVAPPEVRVKLTPAPEEPLLAGEPVTTEQRAEVELPAEELERLWNPASLERLARSYWVFLERASCRLLRVRYGNDERSVTLLGRLRLLRFHAPEYEFGPDYGSVTWRIRDGLLVARAGRDQGFLRLTVRRLDGSQGTDRRARLLVSSRVDSFVPRLALPRRRPRWLRRLGLAIYRATQMRIHLLVTHGFLRSLARVELPESVVGRFARSGLDLGERTTRPDELPAR